MPTHTPTQSGADVAPWPQPHAAAPVALALGRRPGSVDRLMRSCSSRLALLLVPLAFTACRDQRVTAYRIPKEKEPEPAAAAAAAHASAGISPGSGGAAAPGATSQPGSDMANTAVPTASGAALAWSAPAHWQSKSGSAMRKATFAIQGEGTASAELAVTAFPGDVGGEVANVNRWRGQIQLPPLGESEVRSGIVRLEANGLKIAYVDIVNPSAATPTRLLGAWVPYEGSTWFFKLTGPDALVAREKAAFVQFLNTVKAGTP